MMCLVLDDSPMSRRIASEALSQVFGSGIKVPEDPFEVDGIHSEDVGLLIADRIMGPIWQEHRDKLLARIRAENPDCKIIEWSIAAGIDMRHCIPDVDERIQKTGSGQELVPIVRQWVTSESRRQTILKAQKR